MKKILKNKNNYIKFRKFRKKIKIKKFYLKKIKKLFVLLFIQIMNKHYLKLAYNFFKKKKYHYFSQENINLIINKCNGDREVFN